VRTALQALSAVLGGAQRLPNHGRTRRTPIPAEEAMKLGPENAKQLIADETRVPTWSTPSEDPI